MIVILSLLIAICGLLLYALSANPRVGEIGRIMFFCGLFVFLLQFGQGAVLNLFPHR